MRYERLRKKSGLSVGAAHGLQGLVSEEEKFVKRERELYSNLHRYLPRLREAYFLSSYRLDPLVIVGLRVEDCLAIKCTERRLWFVNRVK